MNRLRRLLLTGAAALPAALRAAPAGALVAPRDGGSATVRPADGTGSVPLQPRPLVFPRDLGAHPDTRIEWWYLTGWLDASDGKSAAGLGLQLTFFRLRTGIAPDNPSRFAAHQLLLAHAALADPARGALLHEERIARAGLGLAEAAVGDTRVTVDRWWLQRDPLHGGYRGRIEAAAFTLDVEALPTQPRLLQGEAGYSRKGDARTGPRAASFYYSEPQLDLRARIGVDGTVVEHQGLGWLDHEWSSALLPPQAAGWDWGGYNLIDGSALTVFRVRGADPAAPTLHAYACLRPPGQAPVVLAPAQVEFTPLESWTSPRTRARYPVAQRIRVGARVFDSRPLMPDQEYDARAAGGLVYWEGASTLHEAGRPVGHGYLELTGYSGPAPGAAPPSRSA